MLKGHHYKVTILAGPNGLDSMDDNVDVQVLFDGGMRYVATFFTIANIQRIMNRYSEYGECQHGLYFWAADAIIIRNLTRENISKTIADLISVDEFQHAFSRVE